MHPRPWSLCRRYAEVFVKPPPWKYVWFHLAKSTAASSINAAAGTEVLEPDGPQDTHRCTAAAFCIHVHATTSTDALHEVISQADYFERQLKSCDRDFQDLEAGCLAHASCTKRQRL